MKAINKYVIVDKIKEGPKMMGGLEIAETQDKETRYIKGKIVSIAIDNLGINAGDIVLYDKMAAHAQQFEGKTYYIMSIGDLVALV
jgi:co-chaperonin GroES (HSP10)